MGNKYRTLSALVLIGLCVLNYYYPLMFSCAALIIGAFFLFIDWLLESDLREIIKRKESE
jgi:hypothetical protein